MVAPYEADSQLAFLARAPAHCGGVAAVITEDSDLVAYGCPNVLFKCDVYGGAQELQLADLFSGPPIADSRSSSSSALSFRHFTLDMLQARPLELPLECNEVSVQAQCHLQAMSR